MDLKYKWKIENGKLLGDFPTIILHFPFSTFHLRSIIDAFLMMLQTESSETVATVCKIDAHFGQNYLNNKTKHRYQKEIKIRSKITENQN